MKGLRNDRTSVLRGDGGSFRYRLLADGSILDKESGGRIVGFLKGAELDNVFRMQSGPAKQRVLRKVVENV